MSGDIALEKSKAVLAIWAKDETPIGMAIRCIIYSLAHSEALHEETRRELESLRSLENRAWARAQVAEEEARKAAHKSQMDLEWAKGMRASYEDELSKLKAERDRLAGEQDTAKADVFRLRAHLIEQSGVLQKIREDHVDRAIKAEQERDAAVQEIAVMLQCSLEQRCRAEAAESREKALAERLAATTSLLRELHAQVKGECPSLLNEDSGGDAELACEIEDALAAYDTTTAPKEESRG